MTKASTQAMARVAYVRLELCIISPFSLDFFDLKAVCFSQSFFCEDLARGRDLRIFFTYLICITPFLSGLFPTFYMRIESYIIIVSLLSFFIYVKGRLFPISGNYFFFFQEKIEIYAGDPAFYMKNRVSAVLTR